jgi:hypothetical protein
MASPITLEPVGNLIVVAEFAQPLPRLIGKRVVYVSVNQPVFLSLKLTITFSICVCA